MAPRENDAYGPGRGSDFLDAGYLGTKIGSLETGVRNLETSVGKLGDQVATMRDTVTEIRTIVAGETTQRKADKAEHTRRVGDFLTGGLVQSLMWPFVLANLGLTLWGLLH